MKNKIICLITCILLIIVTIFVKTIKIEASTRVHQHLSNTKEVTTDNEGDFNTHLPIVTIDTGGEEIPGADGGSETIKSSIKIYDTDENRNNYLTDEPTLETSSEIRVRGRSSRSFDKKNYLLKFINEDETKNYQSVMGMGEYNEWVLHGPFLDKTLIRNYMWYNIGAEIMGYAPNVRFCEVFINGEYNGLYVMMDSISVGEKRIDITEADDDDTFCSYIVRVDTGSSDEYKNLNNFTKYTRILDSNLYIDVVYPNLNESNSQLKEYIEDDISEFEKTLYSYDYKNYEQYIDVDSFVNYFIITEFTQNYDAGSLSTYLYKDVSGKYNMCIWDFNNSCNNYIENDFSEIDFKLCNSIWFEMLFKDEEFTEKVIKRYKELRETYLSEEYLLNYIDDVVNYLGDAIDRNFEVWGYTFLPENDLLEDERKIGSYEEAIEQLKEFIINRGNWLDEHIEELRQFSHESANKEYTY